MIHIASSYTADVLSAQLSTLLQRFCNQGLCFHYNQIIQQALLADSDFNKNHDGLNVVLLRGADLFKANQDAMLKDISSALNSLQNTTKVPLLILFTPTKTKNMEEALYYATMEQRLKQSIEPNTNTCIIGADEIQKTSNTDSIFDTLTEKYGHIPYTMNFYNMLAMLIARQFSLHIRKPYKVIVLDCDGTLWQGVVEEDGGNALLIQEEHLALQYLMIDLFNAGFLLCLCSKNTQATVVSVFHQHKDMKLDINTHICSHRINWLPKSINIESLAQELCLSLDSFIFIDDNPAECAQVNAALPEVLVIHLPQIKAKNRKQALKNRMNYLNNLWAFDSKKSSTVAGQRTAFYKNNSARRALLSQSSNMQDFLKRLKIKTIIQEAKSKDSARIIELYQRTNQFHLVPNALSSNELNKCITQKQKGVSCFSIEVTDKYDDYGLVGFGMYECADQYLLVSNFFLSCRILGREIEYAVMRYLMRMAAQKNKSAIRFLFKITEKNRPAIAFLEHIAAKSPLRQEEVLCCSLADLQHIKAKTIYSSEPDSAIKSHSSHAAPQYVLDIAQYCTQLQKNSTLKKSKKRAQSEQDTLSGVKHSLLELMKQHQLIMHKEDIPFIDVGIDSMRSVVLASAIYQRFRIEIRPFKLLKPQTTLKKLSQYLLHQIKICSKKPPETGFINSQYIPLSLAQQQLWIDEQLTPGTSKNNMFCAYELPIKIDLNIMQRAFEQLIAAHDSLRFSFKHSNDKALVHLHALEHIHFKINHLASDDDEVIRRYISQFRQMPFNLSRAPLFRVCIIYQNNTSTLGLCIHHMIHDGWSLNLLIRELSIAYDACSKHMPDKAHTLAYIRFIQWQQRHFSKERLKQQRIFWAKQIGHTPKPGFVYDKKTPQTHHAPPNHRITFKINASITGALKNRARTEQATLYHLLSCGFGLFLSHYADQNELYFISAVSGRQHPNSAEVIGLFTRLLFIKMNIDNQDSFSDLVAKNKKNMDAILNHQDLPFHELMQLSSAKGAHQAGFIFQNYPIHELIINEQSAKRVFADDKAQLLYDACRVCRFGSLVCFMQEYDSKLHGLFEYDTSLFDKKRIHSMIRAFKTLLQHISESKDCAARALPLMDATQYKMMHCQWNQAQHPYPHPVNLLSCFDEQVQSQQDALAVVHHTSSMTYAQLDKKSNQLARVLQKKGVHAEVPVGIFLDNHLMRIVAMLGILKAGGCYVPLDTKMPLYRVHAIIKDASLLFVIGDNSARLEAIAHEAPHCLLITKNSLESESDAPVANTTSPTQLAYIMYTSGSTGLPKGIEIEQKGIVRLVKSPNYIHINASDCIAQTSSFFFDAASFEIWGALLNGARLIIIDKKTLLNPNALSQSIKEKQISILFLTTQIFHAYTQLAPELFQGLRCLIVGGEALSYEAVVRLFHQKNRPSCLINGYGPTENTCFSTSYSMYSKKQLSNPIPIGRPITGTQVYVLDQALNPRPIGAPGMLYLGGAGLARRYVNQHHLNKERFIHYQGERLYNTGDVVAWNAKGQLHYIGRKDNQIKINGHRIELDEIRLQLETHEQVLQAIVLPKDKGQLVAYIVLKPNSKLPLLNLSYYLKHKIPQYMIPKLYYQIEQVPLSAQGKIDKQALLKQKHLPLHATQYAGAENEVQEQVLAIYATVLNQSIKEISIHTDFFDLGGTSISALQLINAVQQQFKVTLSFNDLYQGAHIKALSKRIMAVPDNQHDIASTLDPGALQLIQEGCPEKIPIVFIHPIGGTGFCYLELIKTLTHDRPCYLIQDPSINADRILFEDISSMANYYSDLLLKKIKKRTFILAGYSFGGMLSLQIASALEHKGMDDAVRLIIAFDTWIMSHFMNVAAKKALRLSIMKQYRRVEEELLQGQINPKPWMELQYRRLQNLGFAYKPPIINKKILLFKASQQTDEFSAMNDASNYLDAHSTQGVEVCLVPGTHNSMLQHPHVADIGRLLNQYLKDNFF